MDNTSSFIFDSFARLKVHFSHGKGAWLYDHQGQAYLDFTSGIAVNSFGHANSHLNEALFAQAQKFWHLSNLFPIEGQEKLGRMLCANSFAQKVFFTNSGTETVETAIKTARRYFYAQNASEKYQIITFEGAFHGRTLAALAATAQPKYLEGFEPRMPGFTQVPFGDISAVKNAINKHSCAILIEPIQAEGGVRVAPISFLHQLRELCDQYGLLLILDEIQTGIGRSGKFFAYQWSDITPDILCSAKALGGGFPVGACLTTRAIAAPMTLGTHGTTFGGNPLAMAVGQKVIEMINQDNFLAEVTKKGEIIKREIEKLIANYSDVIKAYHGKGFLIGVECAAINGDIVEACLQEKLLISSAGRNMIRMLPPLILSEEEIYQAMERFEHALQTIQKGNIKEANNHIKKEKAS